MTGHYAAWQQALADRNQGLYMLMGLGALLVISYLLTYVSWLPAKYARLLRKAYEIGGLIFYTWAVLIR